jgi:thiosulfate/3-mercaptopyruvate sulfurtransferase
MLDMKCDRRTFLFSSAAATCLALVSFAEDAPSDPWKKSDLIEPADLAQKINDKQVHILCVGFPQLYRKHRILNAQLAGPASQPDGLAALRTAAVHLSKKEEIVIYCGCCPMKDCPNTRPAYSALKSAGFENVKVLNLTRNLRLDWTEKGYPSEA